MVTNLPNCNTEFGPDWFSRVCLRTYLLFRLSLHSKVLLSHPRECKMSQLKDVLAGAAVAFVKAIRSPDFSNSSVKAQNSVVINSQTSPI